MQKRNDYYEKVEYYQKWLLLLPVLYGFLQVLILGINVVYWDEWEIVRLYDDIRVNGWEWAKLFAQHNEHRIFFPSIVLLTSGLLTHWNVKVNMYISQVMMTTIYFTYVKEYRRIERTDLCERTVEKTGRSLIFLILIGLCCFSAVQWENFLLGFQVGFIMVAFGAAVSFYFYQKFVLSHSPKHLLLSVLFGVVASFSSLQGLAVWAVYAGIFFLLLIAREKKNIKGFPLIAIVGLLSVFLYMKDFHSVDGHPSIVGNGIFSVIKYFFTVVGSIAYQFDYRGAMLLGAIICAVALLLILDLVRRHRIQNNIFAISLIGFGLAVSGMISVGRVGFGIEQAMSSKYTTFAMFSLIGILLIIYQEIIFTGFDGKKIWLKVMCVVAAVILAFTITTGIIMLKRGKSEKGFRLKIESVLQNYMSSPLAELKGIYPWGTYEDAYHTINLLEKNDFNVFEKKNYIFAQVSSHTLDSLEQVSFKYPIGVDVNTWKWDDCFVYLYNPWAADFYTEKEYQTLYVRINENLYQTTNHLERPDVAAYFENPNFQNSGFAFAIRKDALSSGKNECSIVVVAGDGCSYFESEPIALFKAEETGEITNFDFTQ